MTYEFDDAVALSGDRNAAEFPERWTMGPGFVHGGYLMSVALSAAADVSPQPDAVTMSAHFVRPGKVGVAEVHTTVVKSGLSLATVEADIVQKGDVGVSTITTFGNLSSASDVRFQSVSMPEVPHRRAFCGPPDSKTSSPAQRTEPRDTGPRSVGHQTQKQALQPWV